MARTSLLIALAFAALVTAPVPAAAQVQPDTTGILTPWTIVPSHPCVDDSVVVVVRGFENTPCVQFLGADVIDPTHVRIRVQEYDALRCFTGPTQFFPVPLGLGVFAAGMHTLDVEVVTRHVQGDSSTSETSVHYTDPLTIDSVCPSPPPPPHAPLPFVDAITTDPTIPCASRPTFLVLSGHFPNTCGQVIDSETINSENLHLTLKVGALPDTGCGQLVVPWRVPFALGALSAGVHHVAITLVVYSPDSTGTTYRAGVFQTTHDVDVALACDSLPPPGQLPFVERVFVGPNPPCTTPVCEGDSIRVLIKGLFPNTCFVFRSIELVPIAQNTLDPPGPPLVRVTVDDRGCMGFPCALVPTPWSASIELPPMVAGAYALPIEVVHETCGTIVEKDATHVPLDVVAVCPPRCVTGTFPRPDAGPCHTTVSPGHPGALTFAIRSEAALAGLQGTFRFASPSGLAITDIEAIGAAEGMHLDWQATADGAKFVMFSAVRSTVPPYETPDAWADPSAGAPVLRITVEATGAAIAERSLLYVTDLLGADKVGHDVPECPPCPIPVNGRPPVAPPGVAVICGSNTACDFNGDGRENVGDLVLMARCATGQDACPDSLVAHFDCDGDGQFSIADVLCCSRHLLQRPPCPACPPDSTRPEPGVHVRFGDATASAAGIGLPIHIDGGDRIGAAMLTLTAPLDRYDVTGLDAGPDWLALPEARDGQLMIGLIHLSVAAGGAALHTADVMLNLSLKAGQAAGGEVAAVAGQFSGPDGVLLGVDLGSPVGTIPGGRLELSAGRPNPFSSETRFTLSLPEKADAEVGVFDLRGRAVAVLHRGPLAAGPNEFVWDGRGGDGTRVANGVYFYRARVGGQVMAKKLILMRGN